MSFPRYPKYKDSGIEWLGEVPEDWEMLRLKHVAQAFPSNIDKKSVSGQVPVRLCNYTDVYYNETITDDLDLMAATATEAQIAKFTLRAGDTVITKDSETADDIAVGAFVPDDLPGIVCGYHLSIVRPAGIADGAFLKRYFDSQFTKASVAVSANGLTRVGLGQYAIDNLDIALPPRSEQLAIASFLDRETAKIDALVVEQERLIELLKEKRQAVISHAITKGLDPDVPMKDSGVEWLGEVPAHWECVRNKTIFHEVDDRSNDGSGELLTVSHLTGVTRRSEKDVNMFLAESHEGYKRCEPGDLVINTMWAWMGALGCTTLRGIVSPSYNVYRIREPERLAPVYYDYLSRLPQHAEAMKSRSSGVWESRLRLYPAEFLDMRVAVPPLEEQKAIVEHIRLRDLQYSGLVAEAEKSMGVLLERRSALISAAVTGQIDVRHLATAEAA